MNCEEFQRQLGIDPSCEDRSFREHGSTCLECAGDAERTRRFEKLLRAELSAEYRVRVAAVHCGLGLVRSGATLVLPALSLALAALWIGFRLAIHPGNQSDLVAGVVGHLQIDPQHLRIAQFAQPVPYRELRPLFQHFGADVGPALGLVSYAGRCMIAEREGLHLVLRGERGPVTALLMPHHPVAESPRILAAGLVGTILRAGPGSVAIVGTTGEPLEPIARRLRTAVRWRFAD